MDTAEPSVVVLPPRPGAGPVLALAGLLLAATALMVGLAPTPPTAHATRSPLTESCLVLAAAALLVGGALWSRRQPQLAIGASVAATAWLAPPWVGWEDSGPLARSLGMVVGPLLAAGLLHIVAAIPAGIARGPSRLSRAAYLVLALLVTARALVRDPFLDLHCWNNCTDNVLLVVPHPSWASLLDRAVVVAVIATSAGVAGVALRRWREASRSLRHVLAPVLASAACVGVVEVVFGALLLADPFESATKTSYQALFVLRAVGLTALGASLAWSSQHERQRRELVAQVVTVAAELGEDVQSSLRAILGDPRLQVAYWTSESSWVDATGEHVDIDTWGGRRTYLTRSGRPVAAVVSERGAQPHDDMLATLGPGARMALDNARLTASTRAQRHAIQHSRARLVDAGDRARRELERNLHDGAQQRLLAAGYQLGLAARAARGRGDTGEAARLEAEVLALREGMAQLRELAHGIFPVVLAEAGLQPALSTFAATAAVPVELLHVPAGRFGARAESAAYLVVTTATVDTGGRGVRASAVVEGGALRVRVDGSGPGPYVHCADRVGALGGTFDAGDGWLEAVIPCESSSRTTPS